MQRLLVAVILAVNFSFVGCGQAELTPERRQKLEELRSELNAIKKEISEAEAKDASLAGGLVKALVGARIETLKTTEALIQQRIYALEAGAKITVETKGTQANPEEAAKLEKEIQTQEAQLRSAQEEAAQYSGGLVQALKLSAIATHEQTLAMLRQRYLIAKFGLAMPKYSTVPSQESKGELQAASDAPTSATAEKVEPATDKIISVRLLKKRYATQDYQDYVFFDLEFTAVGLDKPTRAVKGSLNLKDLFGETKMRIGWTIEKPMTPGGKVVEKETGFKYNQFLGQHQWVQTTGLENMTASFTVRSILYQDGTRQDLQ